MQKGGVGPARCVARGQLMLAHGAQYIRLPVPESWAERNCEREREREGVSEREAGRQGGREGEGESQREGEKERVGR